MGTNLVKYGGYSVESAKVEEEELGKGGADFMKLEVGKNVVRFLPPPIGRSSPFVVVHQHFIRTDGMSTPAVFACPRMMSKKPCPACGEADRLRATGNPADRERAGEFFSSTRVFSSVIDRKHPEMGPRVLAFGKSIHKELTAIRKDEADGGDFSDPTGGFDIVITRVGTGKNDTEYSVRTRAPAPLADSVEQMNDWIEAQVDVNVYARVPTAQELQKILSLKPTGDRESSRAVAGNGGGGSRRETPTRTAQDDLDASDDEIPFGGATK
jgi:hypothetical protein